MNQAEVAKSNAINQFESLASGGTNVRASSFVAGLSGFTSTLGNLLTSMPKDVRASIFGSTTVDNVPTFTSVQ